MPRLAAARNALIGAGALLVAVAAWRLLPRSGPSDVREPAVRVVVVDASASVVRRRPGWLPWVRARIADEARAAGAAGEHAALIVFAADVELRAPPGPPELLLARLAGRAGAPLDPGMRADGASDLAGALDVAAGLVRDPRRPPGAVVLLGDALATGRDPALALARMHAAGVRTHLLAPPAAELGDAALVALEAPRAVEIGAPLVARATLELRPPLPDRIVVMVELSGSAGLKSEIATVDVPRGGGRVVARIPLGAAAPGRTQIDARLVVAGGDPLPENDRASCATVAAGELVCAVLARDSARADCDAWIARGGASPLPGVQMLAVAPADLARVIDDLDCLLTFDVPLDELPRELVASFVQRGGGWLAVSGYGFLGDWSPDGPPEEGLHPLLPLFPAPLDGGPRDVVLMVDGSGSMSGEPFDLVRTAAVEMVAAALPRDEIQLRFFTETLERPLVLRRRDGDGRTPAGTGAGDRAGDRDRTREAAARSLLSARVPGGSTWILACLDQLADERERSDREALVLLLTDGREAGQAPDPVAKAAGLVARMRSARAGLRVIAVGRDADVPFLERLVAPGEELVRAGDLDDLAQIFQREINRARVVDAPALEVRRVHDGGPLADALLAPADAEPLPPLQRVVRDLPRAGATVLWETADGDPVLAAWQVGLGRTALFASAPRPGWGTAWSGAPERFGALLRWLGRGARERGPTASIERGLDGVARLVVQGLPADAPARIAARLLRSDGADELARLELDLAPRHAVDPGLDRRAARLAPEVLGQARGSAVVALGWDATRLGLPLVVPRPPEFLPAEAPERERAAWDVAPEPAAAPAPGAGTGEQGPGAGPSLLAAGLALVFAGAVAGGVQGRRPSGR
jgi:hypothetical protein